LVIYGGWLLVTLTASSMPWWALAAVGGYLVAWHGSLQHETIHGHPTRWSSVNALIGAVPLGLWLPYGIYRDQHVAHHQAENLTDPLDDPESFYVTPEAWARAGVVHRAWLSAQATLAGRLLLGPPTVVARFLLAEAARVARGDRRHLRAWAAHAAGVTLVTVWLVAVCQLSLARYALLVVYPSLALTLLRSFVEHRPSPVPAHRIASVEAGLLGSLLYLNNNLHVAHHDAPSVPWYELPARYAARRVELLRDNGGYVFRGYLPIVARYALRTKDSPVHPG
jgi:fatty acid desaturase